MPTVTDLQLFAVDLPFRTTFRHAAAARRSSDSLFLRLRLNSGVEGWGECLPRPYVSGESREGAFALLRDSILPALLGHEFQSFQDVTSFLEKCDGKAPPDWVEPRIPQSSAWCSVDLALIDAFGRASETSASVGAPGMEGPAHVLDRNRYSGVASVDRGWRFAVSLLKLRAFRFPHVKLKIEGDGAIEAATMARRLLGRGVDVRIDANMAWDVKQALEVINELGAIGIECFEQPIAADDLDGLAQLVRETSSIIVVDEGLTDRNSLQTLIHRRACTGANVRISKCGGLTGAHARCREALDAGLMLQIGCQVGESSLLSAAHVTLLSAFASSTPGVRYAEGCFGRHLLREDPFSPSIQFRYGGRPPHPPGAPGLGVRVDQEMLERWTVERAHVS
jgi:muconate cycloisomerase